MSIAEKTQREEINDLHEAEDTAAEEQASHTTDSNWET